MKLTSRRYNFQCSGSAIIEVCFDGLLSTDLLFPSPCEMTMKIDHLPMFENSWRTVQNRLELDQFCLHEIKAKMMQD